VNEGDPEIQFGERLPRSRDRLPWYSALAPIIPLAGIAIDIALRLKGSDYVIINDEQLQTLGYYVIPSYIRGLIGNVERYVTYQYVIRSIILSMLTFCSVISGATRPLPIWESRIKRSGLMKSLIVFIVVIFIFGGSLFDIYLDTHYLTDKLNESSALPTSAFVSGKLVLMLIPGVWPIASLLLGILLMNVGLYLKPQRLSKRG